MTTSVDSDPELFHGLTIWCGEPGNVRLSAQIQGGGGLAIYLGGEQQPSLLPAEDARALRDLLNVATARGYL